MREHESNDVIDEPTAKPAKSKEPADVSTVSKPKAKQ